MNQAYSDLKAAWHLDKIRDLRSGQQVVPAQVQLIISDLCNEDCNFCAYRMSGGFSTEQFAEGGVKNPNRKIPTEKCYEILDDCARLGVQAIQFTGGGEPTVHPECIPIFHRALWHGMKASLVTNGILLRGGWETVLPKMAWVRVSIDAGTPETYSRIRSVKPEYFDRALRNVGQIAEAIASEGSACLLGVGYVVTRDNWHEIPVAINRLKETGASYVRLSAMFSTLGAAYYSDIYRDIKEAIAEAKSRETEAFKIVDLFGDRIADLEQHSPDYAFCGYQQFNMYIGGNLKVYRCCTTSYTSHGEVGDLSDVGLYEWFHSMQKESAYANFDARSCHTCQFNGKNRVINYMVETNPVHVEFV